MEGALDALQLYERRPHGRGHDGAPDGGSWADWANSLPEGLLALVGRHLDCYAVSNARAVCQSWRHAFSLRTQVARLDVGEQRAPQARAFLRAYMHAFPSTHELVLEVSFRRTAREKIQAALEEHFQALHDLGMHTLQLNLDLNSFNERKIKLPDVALLSSWAGLTKLTLQESGWRSQQLRVDAGSVFGSLPSLQELSVVCKYSGTVKAKWWRPPSQAERLAARMPKWPPGAGAAAAAAAAAAVTGPTQSSASSMTVAIGGSGGGRAAAAALAAAQAAAAQAATAAQADNDDSAMEDVSQASHSHTSNHQHQFHRQQQQQRHQQELQQQLPPPQQQFLAQQLQVALQQQAAATAAAAMPGQHVRPVVTQHLRCQMTQNQSMAGELQKALRRITPALQAHVSALTFEIVEETYAEPARGSTPLELSALPGLKSLTVLSGAEDALSNSKLDIVGANALESLVVFDVSCGCWCYNKPGHGIPPRLLSSPPPCLRSLTVVGFVVNQCTNLHALSLLTCLEELRLEQPDPDFVSAVSGELLLTWLPSSLRVLKLHSVVLPPCGLALAEGPAGGVGGGGSSSRQDHSQVPAVTVQKGQFATAASSRANSSGSISRARAAAAPTTSLSGSGSAATAGAGAAAFPRLSTAANGAGATGTAAAAPAGPLGGSSSGVTEELLYGVAPVAPLPHLRELYLSKCKVPTLGVLGVCSQLTSLGVINCLSCSGMLPAAAALPALRSLAVIHTLSAEQELGPSSAGGACGSGLPAMPPAVYAAAAAVSAAAAKASGGAPKGKAAAGGVGAGGRSTCPVVPPAGTAGPVAGGNGVPGLVAPVAAGAAAAAGGPNTPQLHVSGLPLPPVVWGSDDQVAAVAACRSVTSLELIVPRGPAGPAAVAALAGMPQLGSLDVSLPCGLSEGMMGLVRLGAGGRLRCLTLWVDSRTCVSRNRARQLQAIQRNLQAHMPDTRVEWAGAESRHSSWTGLEARVFSPH